MIKINKSFPKEIVQVNNTKYYYRADGTKIKKAFTLNNPDGSNTANTEYLDGFQYVTKSSIVADAFQKTDDNTLAAKTANEEETFVSRGDETLRPGDPTTMALSFFPTTEGFYDYENSKYIYQYKDHLGNVRLSYAKDPASGSIEVLDRNDYYPFGMNFVGYNSGFDAMGSLMNYKFGTKELQETGFYDFGARMLMPDVGRWFTVDPLAEKHTRWSPYNYGVNNPIRFIDPDGRDVINTSEGTTYNGANAAGAFMAIRDAQKERSRNNYFKPIDDVTVNNLGKVQSVKKTNDKFNRFFDSNGKQLFFNDPKGVNRLFLTGKFNVGDKIYYPVSNKEVIGAIRNVGLNKPIVESLLLSRMNSGNLIGPVAQTAAYAMIGKESTSGNADFSAHYLSRVIGEEDGHDVYMNDSSYNIRFGDGNKMYSLMDAGNFMWGVWSRYIGLSDYEVKAGSNLNELKTGHLDSDADQRAIFDGRTTKLK